MKKGNFDVKDRISQFPEEILQRILYFLQVKDALCTSLVSKSWYNACKMLPSLDFSENFFPESSNYDPESIIMLEKMDLVRLILESRLRHGGRLQKLRLLLPFDVHGLPALEGHLNSLIPMVGSIINEDMKELAFSVGYVIDPLGTFPEAVYAAKSLTKLSIGGFKMDFPSTGMKFLSLKELTLDNNHLNNELLQLLITSIPNIELLEFWACSGFDLLQIKGLLQLKKLDVCGCIDNSVKIEIDAPNLQQLCLYSLPVFNVTACKSLKIISLNHVPVSKLDDEFFSNFPILETLELWSCETLESLRISTNHLKNLFLEDCENLLQVEIDAPNLSSFTYSGSVSLRFSLKALAVQDICFKPVVDSENIQWQKELTQFLRNFNHSNAVKLSLEGKTWLHIEEEVRDSIHSPLYSLKHMSVSFRCRGVHSSFENLLDTLLWMAPRLETLTFSLSDFKIEVEFMYWKHKDEVQYPCCRFLPIKCWRCSLKRVRVWREDRGDQSASLSEGESFEVVERVFKDYFRKNAEILEDSIHVGSK